MIPLRNKSIVILIVVIMVFVTQFSLGYIWRNSFFKRGNNHSIINPIAYSLMNGEGFNLAPGNPTIEHEFLYPVLVAGCYFVFGINWFGVTLLHSILFTITALLVFFITLKIFKNELVALISLLLTLFHPYLFIHTLSISDTILTTFLLSLSMFLSLRLSSKSTIFNGICLGVSLALLSLTRDSAIILIIAFIVFLLITVKKRKRIAVMLTVIATIIIIITPWLIRNYIVSQRILLSSHGYEVLWQGNNLQSWEYIANNRSVDEIPKPDSIISLRQQYSQRTISLILQENEIYQQEVKRFVMKSPVEFVKLMGLKFIKFWSWEYNPVPPTTKFISVGLRALVYNTYFFPLICFGIIGFMLTWIFYKRFAIFCLLIFALYTIVHMISVGFTRLRLPLDPIITIFAATGIIVVFDSIKGSIRKK